MTMARPGRRTRVDATAGKAEVTPGSQPAASSNELQKKTQASAGGLADTESVRISVPEIARRLNIGRLAVYTMLEQGIIPAVRVGRRWLITQAAYATWESTCGLRSGAGLPPKPEVVVLN